MDKNEALQFEKQLKKWRNKKFIQQQFKEFLIWSWLEHPDRIGEVESSNLLGGSVLSATI